MLTRKLARWGVALAIAAAPIGVFGVSHSAQASTGGGCTTSSVGNGMTITSCLKNTPPLTTVGTKVAFGKTVVNATCQFLINIVELPGGNFYHHTQDCTGQMTLNTTLQANPVTHGCTKGHRFHTEAHVQWHTSTLSVQNTKIVNSPTIYC